MSLSCTQAGIDRYSVSRKCFFNWNLFKIEDRRPTFGLRGKFLATADLSLIVVWTPPDTKTPFTLPGHQGIVGQLLIHRHLLGRSEVITLLLLDNFLVLVSSGCEKRVKVWSLATRSCLHTINCQDGFTNVAAPKIAVDKRFLLVSRTDCIEMYDSEYQSITLS